MALRLTHQGCSAHRQLPSSQDPCIESGLQHWVSYTSVEGTYARPKHSSTPEINMEFLVHMARYLPAKQKLFLARM